MSRVVRPADMHDASAIAEIDALCFSEPATVLAVEKMLSDPNMEIWVLDEDGETVSYCSLIKVLDEVQIVNVATRPQCGSRGCAAELLSYVLISAKEKGFVLVSLEVRISNYKAIGLYEKLGFVRCGVRRNFYRKPTEDAFVMTLDINDTDH